MLHWLVVYLPLWKMMDFVSWDDHSQYMEKYKKCSKPPASIMLGTKIFKKKQDFQPLVKADKNHASTWYFTHL